MNEHIIYALCAAVLYGIVVYEFLKRDKDDDFFNF
jgi:hypothetical protein